MPLQTSRTRFMPLKLGERDACRLQNVASAIHATSNPRARCMPLSLFSEACISLANFESGMHPSREFQSGMHLARKYCRQSGILPRSYPDPTPYRTALHGNRRERGKGNGNLDVGGGGEGAGLTGRSESTLCGASRVRGRFSERPPSVPRRLDPHAAWSGLPVAPPDHRPLWWHLTDRFKYEILQYTLLVPLNYTLRGFISS
jgi:hypothetical protein